MNNKKSIDKDFHLDINEYKSQEAWSSHLANRYGELAALSFAIGIDILSLFVEEDLEALSRISKNSHMGQITYSNLRYYLPEQFLMNYNYDFYYFMKCRLTHLLTTLDKIELSIIFDEIILYIIVDLGNELIDEDPILSKAYKKNWVLGLLTDVHATDLFIEHNYVDKTDDYHFENWFKELR